MKNGRVAILGMALLFCAGCLTSEARKASPANSQKEVKTGGAVVDLKKAPQSVAGRDAFIHRVGELLSASRPAAAQITRSTWP